MSFDRILRQIVDECGGGLAAALMGRDGIAIAQQQAGGAQAGALPEDIGTAGIEFGRILEEARKASDALSGGGVRESVFSLARFTLIFHQIDEDIFLALALAPDGNLGKARYLIRRNLMELREEL